MANLRMFLNQLGNGESRFFADAVDTEELNWSHFGGRNVWVTQRVDCQICGRQTRQWQKRRQGQTVGNWMCDRHHDRPPKVLDSS